MVFFVVVEASEEVKNLKGSEVNDYRLDPVCTVPVCVNWAERKDYQLNCRQEEEESVFKDKRMSWGEGDASKGTLSSGPNQGLSLSRRRNARLYAWSAR